MFLKLSKKATVKDGKILSRMESLYLWLLSLERLNVYEFPSQIGTEVSQVMGKVSRQ